MKTKRAAVYVRVSTGEQSTGAQERALRDYVEHRGWVLHKVYKDHGVSGSLGSRPALDELLRDARYHRRAFDVVLVWKFDRFARSLKTLISALELFRSLRVDFVSVTESVDTSLPSGELVFQIFGAVAQFERTLIGERVRAGLKHAQEKGQVLGRPPLRILVKADIAKLRKDRRDHNVPFRTLAEKYGVSVWTAHRLARKGR
jgi:DNA invertase Pin-like site-specific DNA recombinase